MFAGLVTSKYPESSTKGNHVTESSRKKFQSFEYGRLNMESLSCKSTLLVSPSSYEPGIAPDLHPSKDSSKQ